MDVNMFTPLKRYVVTEQNATGLLNQEPGVSGSSDQRPVRWNYPTRMGFKQPKLGFDQQQGAKCGFNIPLDCTCMEWKNPCPV
jgi:hypothetical protein